jgi:hypothetical protein
VRGRVPHLYQGDWNLENFVKKPKRKLSAAGKAAIVAALKKRWAAKRAAMKAAPAAEKKAVKKNAAPTKAAEA